MIKFIFLFSRIRLRDLLDKLLKSDINKKIAKGAFWSILGSVFSRGLLLIASVIVARLLGSQLYGEAGMVRSTINMFTLVAGLGIGLTATKYISEYKNSDPEKVWRIIKLANHITLLTASLISIFVIILSQPIANQINAPSLSFEIKIGALILFFSTLNGLQVGILAGFEDFKSIAKNTLVSGVFSFIIQISLTYYWGLVGAIIGFGSTFILLWMFNRGSIIKHIESLNINRVQKISFICEYKILGSFSIPAVLSGIMVAPVIWVCNMFLVNQDGGFVQMAIFDIANQWRVAILFIPTALSQIILPILSSSVGDKEQYRQVFLKNLKLNFLIAILVFFLVLTFNEFIVRFYGPGYEDLKLPLIIMTLTTVLVAINNVVGQAIASQGQMWIGFCTNLIWAVLLILSSYILVSKLQFGVLGLSICYLISYFFHTIIQFFMLKFFLLKS